MQDQFVPYGIAIALKEIGYTEACMAHFSISLTECVNEEDGKSGPFGWEKGEVTFDKSYFINNYDGIDYSNDDWLSAAAPLYQQVFNWFRKEHSIDTMLIPKFGDNGYGAECFKNGSLLPVELLGKYNYEEAQDECIIRIIKFIKEKS